MYLRIPNLLPDIDIVKIQRALGGTRAIPSYMEHRLKTLIEEVLSCSSPKGLVICKDIVLRQASVQIVDGPELISQGVYALLRRSKQIAIFVVTLGNGPNELIERATLENRLLDLTIIDTIGSEAVEDLARKAQSFVAKLALREHRATTRRFSPGYSDWRIEEQSKLDYVLNFSLIGVELTPTYMMVPEKSISAIMGIGHTNSLGDKLATKPVCAQCPKRKYCPGPNLD